MVEDVPADVPAEQKRVLLVADHFYPFRGGLEAFCLQVATRLIGAGYTVHVLTYQYDPTLPLQQTHEGIEIYRLPAWEILEKTYCFPKLRNEHVRKTLAHLSSEKWDAVITNTRFFTSCVLGRRIAKKSKSPFIHIEHGNRHVTHPNPLVTIGAYLFDQTVGRYVISSADLVVTISQKGQSFVKKLGAKESCVVYNSVDTSKYTRLIEGQAALLRQQHGLSPDDFVVLFIGRLIEPKGLQHVIHVIDKVAGAKLLVIGDGPYREELTKMAAGKPVTFLGSQPADISMKYYSIANCFVNPSYSEGIPTTILEAGSVGVPVVATDVGGTKEIIPDIRYGILMQPKDEAALLTALQSVQKNKSLAASMTTQLHTRITEVFDWNVNIAKLVQIIERMRATK